MSPRVLVAGIGNIFCSDDGFGVEVARRLRDEAWPDGVRVEDIGIRGVHLAYELLDGYDALVLVDAMPLGAAPGTVAVVEVDVDQRPPDVEGAIPTLEAHSMSPAVVLDMLAGLGGRVGRVVVVGCEPAVLTEGLGLSPVVADAVDPAVAAVRDVVATLTGAAVGTVSARRHNQGGSPVARFRIVPDQSTVEIRARSSLHAITSTTPGVEGFVDVAVDGTSVVPSHGAEGEITFRVERIRSGNVFQDRELHRRIESRRHPTISGRLASLVADGAPERFRCAGDLTFMGVTRRCEDALTIALADGGLRIEGESTFDVRDFGMEAPRILMVRVDPMVFVRLEATAERVDG